VAKLGARDNLLGCDGLFEPSLCADHESISVGRERVDGSAVLLRRRID